MGKFEPGLIVAIKFPLGKLNAKKHAEVVGAVCNLLRTPVRVAGQE